MQKEINSRSIDDLHFELAKVFLESEKQWEGQGGANVFITCTHRNGAMQDKLYAQGRTTKGSIVTWAKAGQSPHNYLPALAFDIAFLKPDGKSLDWSRKNFVEFAKVAKLQAAKIGVKITWGGDWNNDGIEDRKKTDLPHFEISEWKKFA